MNSNKSTVTLHSLWNTKNWKPQLQDERMRQELYTFLKSEAIAHNIIIDEINGGPEHIHCLFKDIDEDDVQIVIREMKKDTIKWFKEKGFSGLNWDDDYFINRIHSKEDLETTRDCIRNQEEYHKTNSLADEYTDLLSRAIKIEKQ